MNPRVIKVVPNDNYTITLTFANHEIRVFDVKPYIDKGIFRELRDLHHFNSVRPFLGSIQWQNGQDFCPDTLYEESKPISAISTEPSEHYALANEGKAP